MKSDITDLVTYLAGPHLPRDKAVVAADALRSGTAPDTIYAALRFLRPLAPRKGADATPFLALITAAVQANQPELASALGLLLRNHVIPHGPDGPEGRFLTHARVNDLSSRQALWRTGQAVGGGAMRRALRYRYAQLYPYWRDPRDVEGKRVLVLNRLPNLAEAQAHFVHNQSNLPHAYAEVALTDKLAFDVFFMVGTDFDIVKDDIPRPDVIYNNVVSAELLDHDGHADMIRAIASHFDVPLINAPGMCLPFTRAKNYERIGTKGAYFFPKTHRFDAGLCPERSADKVVLDFDWPVIIRDLYGHMGSVTTLAHNRAEVVAALTALSRTGAYVIQYHDCPQKDGLFYRYRMFKIGDEVFSSRIHVARGWNVHGSEHDALKDAEPELGLAALERQFWDEPTTLVPHATWDALEQMLRDTQADVIGCDFTLTPNGRALIFEINSAMHVPIKGREAFERLCGCDGYTNPTK